ncbi:MAG: Gfo/Idh/MocA family oxidoreductase [Desulfobacteraceae bacterium]|nr:Gfo/Idh/MocA family oxidoreductase [Desulfobacteraceae bacterium]
MNYNFALIGAAGYVAPRHMKAVKDTGNNLIAALDKSDSVGILDSFSYDVSFFTEFERFDRYAEKLRRLGEDKRIHYVSICSPNYLHDAHIRFALRIGAHAICEKPLVLNSWNLDAIQELERESEKKVYNVLQLRVHPSIIELKKKVDVAVIDKKYEIDLTYITSRGGWYFTSWKGDVSKSGGIATNIGVHFFDMLIWIFGGIKNHEIHVSKEKKMAGFIELEKANVRWFLSVDRNDLPEESLKSKLPTFRSITVDGDEIEFSAGFTDLHTLVYEDIFNGNGYGIDDARASLDFVARIRNEKPDITDESLVHPFVKK